MNEAYMWLGILRRLPLNSCPLQERPLTPGGPIRVQCDVRSQPTIHRARHPSCAIAYHDGMSTTVAPPTGVAIVIWLIPLFLNRTGTIQAFGAYITL